MDKLFGKPPTLPWVQEFHIKNNVWEKQIEANFKKPFLQHEAKLNVKSIVPNFPPVHILVSINKDFDCEWLGKILSCGIAGIRIVLPALDELLVLKILEKIKLANDIYSMKIGNENLLLTILEVESFRVRIGNLKSYKITQLKLEAGKEVTLTTNPDYKEHVTEDMIYVDYEKLTNVVQAGDKIIFNNCLAELIADRVKETAVECTVEKTGDIISGESLTIPGAPIDKNQMSHHMQHRILDFVVDNDIDVVNIYDSYNKNELQDILNIIESSLKVYVFATIDNLCAINEFEIILKYCDGVFIDLLKLQLEIQREKCFVAQKSLIAKANMFKKPVMVTLDFLNGKKLTKSECYDIANMVLDGVDGFIIPQEKCTVEALQNINKISKEAAAAFYLEKNFDGFARNYKDPQIAIALLAVKITHSCKAAAILCTTTAGSTSKHLSYFKPQCPIIIITKDRITARYLKIFHGVDPIVLTKKDLETVKDADSRIDFGISYAKRKGYAKMGDAIVTVSLFSNDFLAANCIKVFYCSKTGFSVSKCTYW
ncbi:unnamed protein product [Brassicogethes aeneus]|uniref:Pyruvate kinase n=1 Tax=Brassicogethes aeneus TaxID=1431903 RepID=A0A9P0BB43_BRAAE|nr:unnamed protein product [Brassicogethes aeneus]